MSKFKEVFQNKHVILHVVHVENEKQAIYNTRIAKDSGCDGVFLIDMKPSGRWEDLVAIHSNFFE